MIKTKIKKAIALASLVAISATSVSMDVFAASNIGAATVQGSPALNTNVVWDDNFPGTASGTVSGIVVSAQILPTLNMEISTGAIDLGTLTPGVEATGNLDIEVGTNAVAGVVITASSGNGGLMNTTDNSVKINSSTADGNAENYSFTSAAGTIDSTITGFANTGDLAKTEVIDSTLHTIYNTNKPELTDGTNADVTFTVATTANAQSPAGNYEDNITFVVTGTF